MIFVFFNIYFVIFILQHSNIDAQKSVNTSTPISSQSVSTSHKRSPHVTSIKQSTSDRSMSNDSLVEFEIIEDIPTPLDDKVLPSISSRSLFSSFVNPIDDIRNFALRESSELVKSSLSLPINSSQIAAFPRPTNPPVTPSVIVPTSTTASPQAVSPTISVMMDCTHEISNGTQYPCDSAAFSELQFNECVIGVNYTFKIINDSKRKLQVTMKDENFQDIIDFSPTLQIGSVKNIKKNDTIDICRQGSSTSSVITKKVLAIGTPTNGRGAVFTGNDEIKIQPP